MEFSPLLPKLS